MFHLMFSQFIMMIMLTQHINAMSDCDTVMIIYYQMGQWSPEPDCCKIPGVICDNQKKVIELQWEEHGLTGPIPKEVGNLVNLHVL